MKLIPETRQALYITGIYLVLGVLWLGFGDLSLTRFSYPLVTGNLWMWQVGIYLLVTAVLLFLLVQKLIFRYAARVEYDSLISQEHIDFASMAPVGIFSANEPGVAIFINHRAADLIGLPAEKCLGEGWQTAVHGEDRDRLRKAWQTALKTGGSIAEEFRWQHSDGNLVWVIGTATPQFDKAGRINCFLGTLTDISERKAAEAARDEAQQRLQLAVDAAQVGLWDWDLRMNRVYYSPEWKRQIGYKEQEIGDSFEEWRSRVHPDDLPRAEANAQQLIEHGSGKLKEEFRFRHKDGSYRWILAQGSILADANGVAARILGAHVDITEWKLAEIALQEGLRKYSELAELSPIGIYHADAKGRTTYVNAALRELAGANTDDQVMGEAWIGEFDEADQPRVIETWRQATDNLTEFQMEYRVRTYDGKAKWVSEKGRPVFDASENPTGFIGTVTDVTPLKQALADLHHSEAFRRLIIDLEPDCVKVLAPNGRLVEMNPAGLNMIDAESLEAVKGEMMADLVVPEHREQFVALHRKVMSGGSGKLAFEIISLKGVRRYLETHAVPLREEGRVVGLLGVTRDVSEQRLAEAQIRESEIRYRELFETNPVPMAVWDTKTFKFVSVNDAMVDHYGYSREELLSMSVTDIRPQEDIPVFIERLKEAGNSTFAAGVFRHIKKNGDIIEVDVTSHPIRLGDHMGMFAQITDVTRQRQVERALEQERQELRETTKRLNHILTTSPTLVFSVLQKGNELTPIWVSDNIERILGYTPEESSDPGWLIKNTHPEDREVSIKNALSIVNIDSSVVNEFRFIKKNGDIAWIRVEAQRVGGDEKSGYEIVGTWSDITEEHKNRERLRLDAAAFASTRDGVLITDHDARIISANRALQCDSGYSEQELLGQTPAMFQSGRHEGSFYQSMWNALNEGGHWQGEIWNRNKKGEVFPVWLTISAVYNEHEELTHYVAIYTDISKLKQSEEELHKLAHYDPLTDLPNRLLFESRLEHAIEQAQRQESQAAVIFMDLDDFKKVNDSLGHVVGDELLSKVAKRLKARVRKADTLARLGGDEFVVLIETLKQPQDVATLARDVLTTLAMPFRLANTQELHVHGSIGISVYPDDGDTSSELLRAADTAMYRAKEEGGDRFLFFTREMSREVVASLKMENALRQGLMRDEFALHFQPKLHLESGEIRSAEALLRWQSADLGSVPPGEFIPVAERSGLIVTIGEWVIDAACNQLAVWRERKLSPINIAVNVSARQFHSPDLMAVIENALKKYQVAPGNLILELTESMLMDRPAEAAGTLRHLKELGVQLSLDDFGTGFSSLAYLTRFRVDTIKIDGSFVQDIETDPSARQIITAIVELSDSLGIKTVAECVETEAQLEFLKQLGCTAIQGFLLSRPLPAIEFEQFLHSSNKS